MPHPLRDATRQLLHRPAVSLAIVATLALAIGANALVFSAVRSVLLVPLPFPDPARLMSVWETQPGNDTRGVAPANFLDWRGAHSFDGLAAYSLRRRSLAGAEPERLTIATVSSNFFRVLGVTPLAGRTFSSTFRGSGPREVVVREDLWRRRFAADSGLVGRTIRLDDEMLVVAGVVPTSLAMPEDVVAWTQAPHDVPELGAGAPTDLRQMRDAWYFRVVGRLKAGVTRQQAQAEMNAIAARLEQAHPATNREAGVRLVNLQEQLTGSAAPMLWILMSVVGCMLAIACANVATLLVAAASGRTRELAIRAALGASRGRLLRQLSVESLLLSAGGGALGLAAAWVARPALGTLLPAGTPRMASIDIDVPVAAFTFGLSLVTALACGAAPALLARHDTFSPLRDGGRSGPSPRSARMASILVAAQLAAALVLVSGAGLMLRSLRTMYQRDIGMDVERLLVFDVTLPDAGTRGRAAAALDFARMTEQLASLPGATGAGAIHALPLAGVGPSATLRVAGRTFGANEAPDVAWRSITPGYFGAVGAVVRRGRGFSEADREGSQPVAIINETLARLLWPGGGAVGAVIGTGLDGSGAGVTVVGIVEDIPQESLHARVRPEMYRPLAQPSRFSTDAMSLVVRTEGDPSRLASAGREAVRQVHPQAPVSAVRTMSAVAAWGIAAELAATRALGLFGGLALVLAAVGLHGVIARVVTDRTREIGVRMALGAAPQDVRRLVLGRTLRIAAAGMAAGAAASWWLSRQLGAWLHGVSGADPLVFAAAASVLVIAALAASYLPVRRASRIDPLLAMRHE